MMLNDVLLVLLVAMALWTVMVPSLLMSAIGLALTSVVLTLLMFQMNSPLAAVFELSVCAGLITVVFVSAISMTKPLSRAEESARRKSRLRRFGFLPVILVATGWLLLSMGYQLDIAPRGIATGADVRQVLWDTRRFDLLGQMAVILTGVFGVVVLFKARKGIVKGKAER